MDEQQQTASAPGRPPWGHRMQHGLVHRPRGLLALRRRQEVEANPTNLQYQRDLVWLEEKIAGFKAN